MATANNTTRAEAPLQADRRDVLKATAGAISLVIVGRSATQPVGATENNSETATLSVEADIPDDTAIQITVYEYESDDDDDLLASDTVTLEDGDDEYDLAGLDGSDESYYDFEIELGSDDGDKSPELFEPLTLEIPEQPLDPDDFEQVTHSADDWTEVPDDAEVMYDEYRLRKYQPRVSMSSDLRSDTDGMYAVLAESEDEETFVCCYWLDLPSAETAVVDFNSQIGSHKPIYVFVDAETEEVEEIVYSGYQYLAADTQPDEDDLEQARADEPTHATFEVIDPYNHLVYDEDGGGAFLELHDIDDERETWEQHQWLDVADPLAVDDPWQMADRESWFHDGLTSFTSMQANMARRLGWAGGSDADELRAGSADGFFSFDFDFSWPWSGDEDSGDENNESDS
ncbi:hypothetical protein [Natronorubrum daqingense]|uniref:Uncharacterized protein n=1 Tax=Natronorubrum daqingense TaxID=588898 RepID=A0A1N7FXT6_9EURY|nr:hypothetical protein [Natronorubrum daqingense]APX98550.1 hypothetical protein BB347_17750 [Natronorubrum daqingense]SIS05183.1 hypothetical protein SAMN05421809_3556 [Natronorubrum daqingense]